MDGLSDAGSTPARSTIILSNTENVSWAGFLIYLRTQRKVIVSEESVKWMDYEECLKGVQDGSLPNCIYEDEFRMVREYLEKHM